jgi:hypothetical protein
MNNPEYMTRHRVPNLELAFDDSEFAQQTESARDERGCCRTTQGSGLQVVVFAITGIAVGYTVQNSEYSK